MSQRGKPWLCVIDDCTQPAEPPDGLFCPNHERNRPPRRKRDRPDTP